MSGAGYEHTRLLSRRQVLRGATAFGLAAATGTLLPGCSPDGRDRRLNTLKSDGPPETSTIRLYSLPDVQCIAAQYMAEPFLREEGFTDVQYPSHSPKAVLETLQKGEFDFAVAYAATVIPMIEAGAPLVLLGGVHVGCWQVFANQDITSLRDFRGKTVSLVSARFNDGVFLAMTLNEVGLDLHKDVNIVNHSPADYARILSSGEVDALVAFPPVSLELRLKGIGKIVISSVTDPPWSNYYCCTAVTTRDWMEKHPAATRRALRAVLKGADVVTNDPDGTARLMVERGYSNNFNYTCDILKEIPYNRIWQDFDPVDSVRFYALRMKQAGLIESTPEEILKKGTDFRYLNELKLELKEA